MLIEPRSFVFIVGFEIGDESVFLLRQADIVETVEQAVLAERINVEFESELVAACDDLFFKIDGDRRAGFGLGGSHQLLNLFFR